MEKKEPIAWTNRASLLLLNKANIYPIPFIH